MNIEVWKIDELKAVSGLIILGIYWQFIKAVQNFIDSQSTEEKKETKESDASPSKGLRRSNTLFAQPDLLRNNDNKKPSQSEKPDEKTSAQEKIAAKNQPAQEEPKQEKDVPKDTAPKVVNNKVL